MSENETSILKEILTPTTKKCPDCGGNMIGTEWNEKFAWFKCINDHVWIKEIENGEQIPN
jgi:ssDNA-binding Zn-finger/Zn-ribbon topoisomerase 1